MDAAMTGKMTLKDGLASTFADKLTMVCLAAEDRDMDKVVAMSKEIQGLYEGMLSQFLSYLKRGGDRTSTGIGSKT
jgi:hypothetical protein